MCLSEIEEEFKELLLPKYRARQVYDWLSKGVKNFDEMTNISKSLREMLKSNYVILGVEIEKKFESNLDDTVKYLFRLHDNEFIEAVLMKYNHGYSMCISTQVGCKMGCKFCATGKSGFLRNLEPSEMLSQIQVAQHDNDIRISNIVLMGMGEPLDNYKNVLKFQEGLTGKMDKTIAVDRVLQTDYISNLFFRVLSNGFATRVGKSAFN